MLHTACRARAQPALGRPDRSGAPKAALRAACSHDAGGRAPPVAARAALAGWRPDGTSAAALRQPRRALVRPPCARGAVWVRAAAADKDYDGPPATLTPATEWRLVLTVQPPSPTEDANDIPADAPSLTVELRGNFSEDEGYEPPQGLLEVTADERGMVVAGANNRWKLAEEEGSDPLDKGGLWIWGMFKEPLYPFLFLQLEMNSLTWPSGEVFPGGKVFVKVPHARSKSRGVVLTDGTLAVRETVTMDADLVGLSKANIAVQKPCGVISVAPVL